MTFAIAVARRPAHNPQVQVRALGYSTELIFARFDGEVVDRGHYLAVRTPSNPGAWWGNFLLFAEPPTIESLSPENPNNWLRLFEREIAPIGAKHVLLSWDRPDGAIGEVHAPSDLGLKLDHGVILVAETVRPPPQVASEVRVRPVVTDLDWALTEETLAAAFIDRNLQDPEGVRAYVGKQLARYRRMINARMGTWYGAFMGDEVAGALGIFRDGSTGRFQLVGTHPKFRRRGVCGTLVYEAAREAFATMAVSRLVIAADGEYHAARVYESVGFAARETLYSLLRPGRPT